MPGNPILLVSLTVDQDHHYLSLYEFASASVVDAGMAAMERPGREAERATFHDWETRAVHDVQPVVYSETYRHSRDPADGAWAIEARVYRPILSRPV
jgi:hypothetical protein